MTYNYNLLPSNILILLLLLLEVSIIDHVNDDLTCKENQELRNLQFPKKKNFNEF